MLDDDVRSVGGLGPMTKTSIRYLVSGVRPPAANRADALRPCDEPAVEAGGG